MVEATRSAVVIAHGRPWSMGIGEGGRVGRTKFPARRPLFTKLFVSKRARDRKRDKNKVTPPLDSTLRHQSLP